MDSQSWGLSKAKSFLAYFWIPRYPYAVSYCPRDDWLARTVTPCLEYGMPTDEWPFLAAARLVSSDSFRMFITFFGGALILLLELWASYQDFPHTISEQCTPLVLSCRRRNLLAFLSRRIGFKEEDTPGVSFTSVWSLNPSDVGQGI